jgi:uncharacterized protein (DUF433 family)
MLPGDETMNWRERVTVDPEVLAGKPVVKGTRLSVEFIVGLLAEGWTDQQLRANYPSLSEQDVRACLAYAAEVLRDETTYRMPA